MDLTPEQQAAMQEKLKNMSPEELKEFQKQQCIFCQMIAGKVQVKKVYEDDICFAILDIAPANPGHILLMPKEHYPIMPIIPPNEIGHMFIIARELSHALLRALGVEGTNIFVANGAAAGQRAQHFMIHIIPRMEGDNVNLRLPRNDIDENKMIEIQKVIAIAVSQATGISEPVQKSPVEIQEPPAKAPIEKEALEKKEEVIEREIKEDVTKEKEEKLPEKEEATPVEKESELKPPEPRREQKKVEDILPAPIKEEIEKEEKKKLGKKKQTPTLDMISDLLGSKK